MSLRKWCRRLWFSESAQGLVEYSVILGVLSVGLVAVLLALRNSTGNVYNGARSSMDQVIACSNGTSTACTGVGTGGGSAGNGQGNGGGNGQGNNGNGNGNGGGNGSNSQGGGRGINP